MRQRNQVAHYSLKSEYLGGHGFNFHLMAHGGKQRIYQNRDRSTVHEIKPSLILTLKVAVPDMSRVDFKSSKLPDFAKLPRINKIESFFPPSLLEGMALTKESLDERSHLGSKSAVKRAILGVLKKYRGKGEWPGDKKDAGRLIRHAERLLNSALKNHKP